jgi:cytochrome P450
MPEGSPLALSKTDPPEHRRLRGLIASIFAPRRLQKLTSLITEIVDELLEPAIAKGKMDGVTEFASPLPQRVIAEMLGVPLKDRVRLLQWTYQLAEQFSVGVWNTDNSESIQYFSDLLNRRKQDPQDDLVSTLLAAEENGVHLTDEEIISMCLEVMLAGTITTTSFLKPTLLRLCQYPEFYQTLRDDPLLIPGALEELLRFETPTANLWRTALHDTMINGQEIKAGQYVVAWAGAANFDETYFPHSEQFDIRRSPNPQLTLGHGPHFCLGYLLARLQGRIVLERALAHFSEMHLTPEDPMQYREQTEWLMQSLGLESIS